MGAHKLNSKNPIENIELTTLRSAVEYSRGPLIITDSRLPDNPIVYSNKAFQDLTGYDMDEIIGRNCRFLQGEDSDEDEIAKLREAVKKGESARVTIKNYHKDGSAFWNDLVVSPVKDAKGAVTHFVGMQLDITKSISEAGKLKAKTRQLEAANTELEQFTYAVSHDLQEPLRMISSYLQLIGKRYGDKLDKDALAFMGYATEGADRLQTLIYDLLSLSRVSTTTDKFKKTAMDIPVERAVLNLKASIDEADAKIEVGELPNLRVDPVQMTQLFQNLISNAIKYRHKDKTPRITISAERQKDEYVFKVADNGIGIDKQHFGRIFQVFQRLHTRKEYEGTGVGLSICSKIVDRHGGKMSVESELGKGSAFYFSLPVASVKERLQHA